MKSNNRNLDIQVVLGNPKIDCDGYGICKIITGHHDPSDKQNKQSNAINAVLAIKKSIAALIFNTSDIPQKTFTKHFETGFLTMETSLRLPQSVIKYFKIPPSVLLSGKYKIYQVKQQIIIYCFLKQDNELPESTSSCLTCKQQTITI